MRFFTKSVSFLAVMSVVPAAFALTSRAGIVGNASLRVPTISHFLTGTTSSSSSSTTTSSTLLQNAECIEAYTSCMKGADACGPDFEECTTNVLFHGKMPQCLGTLAQCEAAGINSLFGTSNISALANVATTNSYGEVTRYTYPTDGSVLGQLITGAAISNQYDTSTCVRRYTSCLKKESVCGNDFELCTTNTEFRKQRVFCDSTLARCQADGLIELLGSASASAVPTANSRVGEMIAEGAALAAVNAVSTCYKVVDQCILGACAANPYKCYEKATESSVKLIDAINSGDVTATADAGEATFLGTAFTKVAELISANSISAYIRGQCQSTIGANKYCYATFLGDGRMPTASQLSDEDNQAEVYAEAYNSRMNSAMKAKIAELVNQYDTKAKNKCVDTIKSCVMRVCGGGSGAACYAEVFGSGVKSINKSGTWEDLQTGCSAIVNSDPYCKYAAENPNSTGTYNYTFVNGSAFETLFPMYEDGGNDPIGVIATLNASLATSYNDAAIAQMKKQCQSVATSCVKSMCGADYSSCYRNRTDVYSSLTNTGDTGFDKSMNKVGGVLDYTIVLGLCLDTVKNASVCEEHLAIESNKLTKNMANATNSWGGAGSVREGWIDAGAATSVTADTETVQAVDANGNNLCTSRTGDQGVCYTVDASGNVYDTPVTISYTTYVQSQAASTLFKDLVYDLEKEAQAKYNAALTREQNACLAANNNQGLVGKRDNGSTYMWVKLKSTRVPTNYSTMGLTTNQFTASNDLYGSFCRVRITMHSDDLKLQEKLKTASWATAYFATGDTFTCGSWIPEKDLDEIASAVASDATSAQRAKDRREAYWYTLLGTLGGGTGGAFLGESIRKGNMLGGLTNIKKPSVADTAANANSCARGADTLYDDISRSKCGNDTNIASWESQIEAVITYANKAGVSSTRVSSLRKAMETVKDTKGSDGKRTCTAGDVNDLETQAENMKTACEDIAKSGQAAETNGGSEWITIGSSAVGALAGGLIVHKAVRDIQKTQLSAAEKAAYEEWMNTVGRHLSCYVGEDEIPFGAVASITTE